MSQSPHLTKEELRTTVGMSCLFLLRDGTVAFLTNSTISRLNVAMSYIHIVDGKPAITAIFPVEGYDDALAGKDAHRYDIMSYIRLSDPTAVLNTVVWPASATVFDHDKAEWHRPPFILTKAMLEDMASAFVDAIDFGTFKVWADGTIETPEEVEASPEAQQASVDSDVKVLDKLASEFCICTPPEFTP